MASLTFCTSIHVRPFIHPCLGHVQRAPPADERPRTPTRWVKPRPVVHMKKGKKGEDVATKRRGRGSGFSKEQNDRLKKVAEKFGVNAPKAGDRLDRQFTSAESREEDAKQLEQEQALYKGIVKLFGQSTLDKLETATYFVLSALLIGFLGSGLAIGVEAFFKSTQKEIPQTLENVVLTVEQAFTPLLIVFLIVSSILGLYKQAQLNAGAAQYDESKDNRS